MKKKETLIDLLHAEVQRSVWLYAIQLDVEHSDFEGAMCAQFEYLYWHDECTRLWQKFADDRWRVTLRACGG